MALTTTQLTHNGFDPATLTARVSNGERLTVKHLAKEFKLKSPVVKQLIVDYYGSRVQFKRGRTGGIVFTA
jgi:hypothetical protein